MDANRDAALKCLRIGMEALGTGDRARALKFLSKGRRLDPSLPLDDLLSAAGGGESNSSASSDGVSHSENTHGEPDKPTIGSASPSSSTIRNRSKTSSGDGPTRSYTEEQVTIVRQIRKQKDYYEILGLEHNCTVEDVRRAYRKLSLKVHPDKNKAPGAEEAFKEVSKAFQCLSDVESRKSYDLCGSDKPSLSRASARHHDDDPNGFYYDNFDADEIFRSFVFGGMPQGGNPFGPFHFRTGGMHRPNDYKMHRNGKFNIHTLIQILPIIIFLLVSFVPSSGPVYMLSHSYPYEYKMVTPRGVPYFVKSEKFEQENPFKSTERVALEKNVEANFFDNLAQNCELELRRQMWGLSSQTPHCDMLRKYEEMVV